MKTVIILKSESDSSENYTKILQEHNFLAKFVSPLDFKFKKLNELKEKLMSPDKYIGIIFTSPRSIDAVHEALLEKQLPLAWKELYNYCIGEITYKHAKSCLNGLETKGKETGNANNLADYIRKEYDGNRNLPFLFPCGNLRQDTILLKLSEAGFLLDPIEVYETIPHPELGANLSNSLANDNVEFLAFFSPSGVNYCYEYFIKNNLNFNEKKLIAIGPSTRKSMEDKGLKVYKTAEKPSVEYLVKALIGPKIDETFEGKLTDEKVKTME